MTITATGSADVSLQRPPHFFLVGAPKCATSSLHALLIKHPDIFMCSPKEPHFFCTDLGGLSEVADATAYDQLFEEAADHACLGEASAFYLMSGEAPKNIKAVCPNARIILSIREPAQAARSLYHQLRDGFREDQKSFEEAWALQEQRAAGQNLPSYCPEPRQLQYAEVYSYADQVARYLEVFGAEQVLVLRFEEITKTPDDVVDRILAFLDLPAFPTPVELPRTNTRRQARFPALTNFISAPPPLLKPFVAPMKRFLNAIGIKPSVIMMKYFSKSGVGMKQLDKPDPAFQSTIRAAFREDIVKLEEIINLDLSSWYEKDVE